MVAERPERVQPDDRDGDGEETEHHQRVHLEVAAPQIVLGDPVQRGEGAEDDGEQEQQKNAHGGSILAARGPAARNAEKQAAALLYVGEPFRVSSGQVANGVLA